MPAEVIFAPEVEHDIADAYAWYEARRAGLGEEFLSCVDARVSWPNQSTRPEKNCDFALWTFVVMPEHVHLIVCPRQPIHSIENIRKAIKEPMASN